MNLLTLSLSYLRRRPLTSALNVLLMALGVATIVVLLLFSRQLAGSLAEGARGIHLVVGAKGSPLQLILSAVYHIDAPTGNVALEDAALVARNPAVRRSIPLAMGDSFRGFPVVGTTAAYPAHYGARLAAGRLWAAPFEVTLGADVAAATRLGPGARFVSSHGLSEVGPGHEAHPMHVVGVLTRTGTVLDRLVLTGVPTVWATHGEAGPGVDHAGVDHADDDHTASAPSTPLPGWEGVPTTGGEGRDLTALLVTLRSPAMGFLFARTVDGVENLKAAQPAFEIARLMRLLGVGVAVLRAFGALLMLTALLGVFVTLYSALQDRRYDLAMMRTLGAPRGRLFAHVLLEGLVLAALGLGLGLLLGHGAAEALGRVIADRQGFRLTGWDLHPLEGPLALAALGVGAVAALLPAWQAYRTDLAGTLAGG